MARRGRKLGLAPSKLNDGRFLHHVPKVDFKNDGSVMETAYIVAAEGWEGDLTLWQDAADCGPVLGAGPPTARWGDFRGKRPGGMSAGPGWGA